MAKTTQMLSILSRINPAIFDYIFPHGPVQSHGFASRISEVALNPQPLPPEPPPERLQRASALIAREIAFAAIAAEAAGQEGGGVRMINSAIDDWCGNGRPPIPIPWPGPWPFAFALDAVPKDLDVATSRLVGALSFAAVAQRMGTRESARSAVGRRRQVDGSQSRRGAKMSDPDSNETTALCAATTVRGGLIATGFDPFPH